MEAKENAAGRRALTWITLVVVLTAGLAGCIGNADEPSDGTAAEPTGSGADPVAPASGQAAATSDASGNASANVTWVERTYELSWNGSASEHVVACVFTPVADVCEGRNDLLGSDEDLLEFSTDPAPIRAEFTMTWEDPTGDVPGMFFGLYTTYCCTDYLAAADGIAPPLTISAEEIDLGPDADLGIYVQQDGRNTCEFAPCPTGSAYALAAGPVEFTITGTYTVLEPLEEAAGP